MTKIENNESKFTKAELLIIERAEACNAPVKVAANQVAQKRVYQASGSRNSAAKQFVDTRNDRKISIGAAREIIRKFEKAL